ncbi:MAG TPA: MFS transporter [Gaiellaceae bacterium]|nr:MFS transporter [Gaiellaceae bacterium]
MPGRARHPEAGTASDASASLERPRAGPAAAFALLRQRNFGPYFVGNAVSATGAWFQNLAAAVLILRLTDSAFLLGVLQFAQFGPILLLAPWTGSAADRFDRRRLLLIVQSSQTALAGVLAALAFAGRATEYVVLGFALVGGVLIAFGLPAQQALLASLVDRDDLPSAVGLNSMTYNLARAIGPSAAALVIDQLGIATAFAINSASYVVLATAVLIIRPRPQVRAEVSSSMVESFHILRRQPRLAAFLVIVAAVGFASDPVNTLAPAFAREFGRDETVGGYLLGAFGAGAVAAALLLAGRTAGSRRRMVATLTMLGGGMVLFSLTPWLPVAMVLLVVAGFGYLASNTSATSRLQLEVEEAHRGRIMALWGIAFLGVRPFASLVDGAIASAAGVRTAGVVLAVPALLCAAAVALLGRRRLRT